MGLPELLAHLEEGIPFTETAVVFTVDDGYADFPSVAAPIFAAYDCPVTVFLITDFVSGKLWNWFDRVPWIIDQTARSELRLEVSGVRIVLKWRDAVGRSAASEEIVERLKRVADGEKEALIRALADSLDVALPAGVPERDRAMTWDQVRKCAREGVTFGPHTVTHPILSRVDARRSHHEIAESWRKVSAETDAAVPVFCYPNGTVADFSTREKESVARMGLRAALSTVEASVGSRSSRSQSTDRFAIPRFSYPETKPRFVQIASGLEAMRGRIVRA
jgi:peptidoglycan/xylan/chitin deacetylase (PgdA/CDA1 family)